MHAASRAALAAMEKRIDEIVHGDDAVLGGRIGGELFDVVEVLDGDRQLRVAVAEASAPAEARSGLLGEVLGESVSAETRTVAVEAAGRTWSSPREFRAGLVLLGRRALLRWAEADGSLERVEGELVDFGRILVREGRLTQLLSDRTVTAERKRELAAGILYGKVTAVTEALALQVVGRPERNIIDDLNAVAAQAAAVRGRRVARVTSAAPITDAQREALAEKLKGIYGAPMSVHSEVDETLLGGAVVRVGDERIDGSLKGRIERLRARVASR